MYRDFIRETLADVNREQFYGLEKFWAFLKYYKYSRQLDIEPALKQHLAKYKKFDAATIDVGLS